MNFFLIYLAGVLIVPLMLPPTDPQELQDVAGTWLLAFLWPLIALLLFSVFLIVGALLLIGVLAYVIVIIMCHILTPK